MSLLHVAELSKERTDEAYALVRVGTGWSVARWAEHLASLAAADGGVLSVTAPSDVLLGVASYRIESDPRYGRALRVEPFVAFELGRLSVRRALCDALEALADELGCSVVLFARESRGLLEKVEAS